MRLRERVLEVVAEFKNVFPKVFVTAFCQTEVLARCERTVVKKVQS